MYKKVKHLLVTLTSKVWKQPSEPPESEKDREEERQREKRGPPAWDRFFRGNVRRPH